MDAKRPASLYELLRRQTSRIPITDMDEYRKYLVFSGVLLGMPEIKGAFRPRDLPFDKDAVSILEFSNLLTKYCFDISLPVNLWSANIKHIDKVDLSQKHNWRRISDFIVDLGLVYSSMNLPEVGKMDPATARQINMTITLLLILIEGILKDICGEEWAVNEIARCFIELELDKNDYYDKILMNYGHNEPPKKYGIVLEFFKDVAQRQIEKHAFSIYSVKLLDINRKFLKRWKKSPAMQRGASGLVYFAIAIIREKIIRELGPASVIHDYAGTLFFTAPDSYKIGISDINRELVGSFKPGGWIHSQFRSALRYSNSEDSEFLDTFPEVSLKPLAENQRLSDLSTWKQEISPGEKSNDGEIEIIGNGSCEQCKQYDAVGTPRRWKSGKNSNLCNICLLIADGVSPMLRFRFMSDVINYFCDSFSNLTASFHLNAKNNTMNESGETGFFCTDGNGVGRIVWAVEGIYELRRKAMEINFDLHRRIREALQNIYMNQKDKNSVSVEMLWLGGDDLLVRCKPEVLKYFEDAFTYKEGDLFSYAAGTAVCKGGSNGELIKGRITSQENMRKSKERMKAAEQESS